MGMTEMKGRATRHQDWEMEPGEIRVRFRQGRADSVYLQLRVRHAGGVTTYYDDDGREVGWKRVRGRRQVKTCLFTSVECPFWNLLAWLEAISSGVQECVFYWDAEGPDGRMQWKRGGVLTVTYPFLFAQEENDPPHVEVQADGAQVVRAFYQAFRAFVQSSDYCPEAYEQLSIGEELSVATGREFSVEELRGQLLPLDAAAAERRLQELRPWGWLTVEGKDPFEKGTYQAVVGALAAREHGATPIRPLTRKTIEYIPSVWNRWGTERRRQFLQRLFETREARGAYGAPLRKMRSEVIEGWMSGS